MNSRIYTKELFEKELLKIVSKKYCQKCFSKNNLPILSKTITDSIVCEVCGEETILVNKEEVRNLKIERVVKNNK